MSPQAGVGREVVLTLALKNRNHQNGRLEGWASAGGRGFLTSLLGTSVHRKLLSINELSAYNVSRSDRTGEDTSYRAFLEMSQPSGRDR